MADAPSSHQTDSTPFDFLGLNRFASTTQTILRMGAGLLFMQHGAQKLFGLLGGNAVELFSQMGLAGILEFFGGLAVVVGLFTRPVALILALEMLIAYFMAHQPQGGFPIQNGGELSLFFAITFLFFAAAGAGPASLDRKFFGTSSTT